MTALKLRKWDSAEHLKNEEDMALYLEACLQEAGDDAAFIAKALGTRNIRVYSRYEGTLSQVMHSRGSDPSGAAGVLRIAKPARSNAARMPAAGVATGRMTTSPLARTSNSTSLCGCRPACSRRVACCGCWARRMTPVNSPLPTSISRCDCPSPSPRSN